MHESRILMSENRISELTGDIKKIKNRLNMNRLNEQEKHFLDNTKALTYKGTHIMTKPIYEKEHDEYFLYTKTTVIEDLQRRIETLEDSNNDLKEEITKLKITKLKIKQKK